MEEIPTKIIIFAPTIPLKFQQVTRPSVPTHWKDCGVSGYTVTSH